MRTEEQLNWEVEDHNKRTIDEFDGMIAHTIVHEVICAYWYLGKGVFSNISVVHACR